MTDGDRTGRDEDRPDRDGDGDRDHLADVGDDCGCAEVWERLSEYRERERDRDRDSDRDGDGD